MGYDRGGVQVGVRPLPIEGPQLWKELFGGVRMVGNNNNNNF